VPRTATHSLQGLQNQWRHPERPEQLTSTFADQCADAHPQRELPEDMPRACIIDAHAHFNGDAQSSVDMLRQLGVHAVNICVDFGGKSNPQDTDAQVIARVHLSLACIG
jgi:hypothetical protein